MDMNIPAMLGIMVRDSIPPQGAGEIVVSIRFQELSHFNQQLQHEQMLQS
jgi:hypothetical protein